MSARMHGRRRQCVEKHGTGWRPRLCIGGVTRNGRVYQQKKDAVREWRMFHRNPTQYEPPGREVSIPNVERHGSGWRARVTIKKKTYKGALRQTVAEARVDVVRLRREARSLLVTVDERNVDESIEKGSSQNQDIVHACSTR